MKILITGAKGFIGRNLVKTLITIRDKKRESNLDNSIIIYEFDKENDPADLDKFTRDCDYVIHLAGVNRPDKKDDFYNVNEGLTSKLCFNLMKNKNICPVMLSSSIQVGLDNDYAKSKFIGEQKLHKLNTENGNPIVIYRFANLFGKWCRPNYNSVVATWCYKLSRNEEIIINDANITLHLCYIDDVINEILNWLCEKPKLDENGIGTVKEIYTIRLGELLEQLLEFKNSRQTFNQIRQSNAFVRKLYATYLSYLPIQQFAYPLEMKIDTRGSFTEFLRSSDYGQISINIAHPGITKGEHWHNTKNEKFLVVSGEANVQFRNIYNDETIEYKVSGSKLEVIDIPVGYVHNIINIGSNDLVTVMWANEVFDISNQDTYYEKVIL